MMRLRREAGGAPGGEVRRPLVRDCGRSPTVSPGALGSNNSYGIFNAKRVPARRISRVRPPEVPAEGDGIAPRRVALVIYPGALVLDLTGPAAVFSAANRSAGRPLYTVEIVSADGRPTKTGDGITMETRAARSVPIAGLDTMLVVGGEEPAVRSAIGNRMLRSWVVRAVAKARRYGSVCSGAFVLASYGLLDGRRVATHWDACTRLAENFPKLTVDAEALYVVDGPVWTSAGVTTGIDMALAMVEADTSAALAGEVAQRLVVYARRPGHQSQFSALLHAQVRCDAQYAELVDWVHSNLETELGVESLAKRAGQSPRDFYRKFSRATGQTPARFVENLRLDRVRVLLSHALGLKEIADQTGFGSPVRMSRAFERRFGVKPSMFRQMLPAAE
jgi:transcriptional regulator GlxA family with amidase domain